MGTETLETIETIDETVTTDASQTRLVDFLQENSTVKSNGVREVKKSAYFEAMDMQGVTKKMLDDVGTATDAITEAAARLSMQDLSDRISNSAAEDLGNEEFRRGLSATTRLPTHGGSTEVTLVAERADNNPQRRDEEGKPEKMVSHGRVRVTTNTTKRLNVDFHKEASDKIRSLLNIT